MNRLTDTISLMYLAFTAFLAWEKGLYSLAYLHLLLGISIVWISQTKLRNSLGRVYPYLLSPLAYMEVDSLRQTPEAFDELVMTWETRLFGTSPAIWLSETWDNLWFSEFLHLSYLSFYLLIPFLAWQLWNHPALHRYGTLTVLAYFSCFLTNIFFPVVGPRHLFPPLAPELQGPIWRLTHWLLGQGAAGAAAFPSGHAAVATLVAIASWRWHRRLFWGLLPFCSGLCLATIYGRFHYAVDTLAGMGLVVVLVILENEAQRRLGTTVAENLEPGDEVSPFLVD